MGTGDGRRRILTEQINRRTDGCELSQHLYIAEPHPPDAHRRELPCPFGVVLLRGLTVVTAAIEFDTELQWRRVEVKDVPLERYLTAKLYRVRAQKLKPEFAFGGRLVVSQFAGAGARGLV